MTATYPPVFGADPYAAQHRAEALADLRANRERMRQVRAERQAQLRRRLAMVAEVRNFADPHQDQRREQAKTRAQKRAEWIEDLVYMLDTGESISRICTRLGTNRAAIAKRLERACRHDLARYFRNDQTERVERAA